MHYPKNFLNVINANPPRVRGEEHPGRTVGEGTLILTRDEFSHERGLLWQEVKRSQVLPNN